MIQTNLREGKELLSQQGLGEGVRIEDEWNDMSKLMTREDTRVKMHC